MTHQFYGEKRQRFSFRKLSVGLVSATIGSFFLSGQITGDLTSVKAAEIQSQQSAQVKYHYVVESELTEAEKSALIREIPKHVEDASETYYLVYRPTTQGDSSGVLPKTGHSGLWESTFTAMGLALLVLVVVRGRNGKRYLSSILLVTGMGSILLSPTVLAVTNIELAAYNQSLNLGLGDALPAPLKIDGYDYIGYLKNEEQNDSHLAHSAHKENPTLDLEKEKGSELKPSETNLDMKEIVSDKGDALTEEEREAIAAKERESARLSTVYDLPELKISEQESVQELPYQTKYQYTDELAQGQSKVIQSGVRGQRTVVTRHYHENQEIVKSEMISDQVTLEPVSEIILVGTAPTNSILKETPVHEVPELTEYGTTPETAPVHEVPELAEYGTTPDTAPVHEVPELTEYGTSPETAPVHEVSELTEYGTSPETAPVHEVSELTEYGTSPETSPVRETPELTEYGTTPDTAPVHEVPELAEYGTSSDTPPVQEIPELTEYGTTPETSPVHEVPELAEYGTSPETASIHENSELELTTNDEVRIEKIDFSIEEQYTDEIPEGSRQITAPGVQGERTIKTRVYSSNGQVVDRQELSNEETLAPVTQIVKVGTAKPTMIPNDAPKADALPEYPLTYTDETRVEKINFTIREEETDELVRDARQIATPGVQGERTIKTRVYSSNGQEVDRQELSNEETLAPVTQVVKVGTAKPNMVPSDAPKADALPEYPLTYTDETLVEKIAFNIEEQYTDELVRDARQITTPGVQGERTIKTRVYSSNGQVVDRQELSNEETLAPVTQIVKVGTAKPTMVPSDAPKADALEEFDLISLHNLLAEADQIKAQARYFNDSQSHQANYDAALTAGQAILSQSQASQAEVNQLVEQINQAKAQLSGLEVVKTALQTEYDLNPTVKTSVKYKNADSEKQTAYTDELTKAEGVLNNQTATQVQVNQALASLTAAKEALNGVPKVKPTVSILSLTENADDKSVTVQYRLEDQTQSFRSATAELYQGDQLIRTLPITNFAGSLKIGDLDYYTGYTLKTKLTYELDNGSFTEFETDSRNFELEYKKIAFRDIDSVEFYHKENDQYKRYDAALTAGQAILSQSQASQAEVNQLVEQINQAKAQLSGLEVVKTALQTEYDLNPTVKTSVKYKNADSEKQTAYTDELTKAEGVLNNQTATQVQVNQALASLTAAKEALNGVPKVKPTVSILSLTENADDKSVTVQYRLEDQTQSFRSATAELYQGDQLIRTLPITNFAGSLKIGDLDYYTGYTLKTKLTYELDNGSFTEFETDSRNFELEYKKIAFRDIDSVEFYHKENDQYKRFVSMNSMPTDLSTYFVKIKSSESKEILLPVQSISEAEKDGKAVYKVNVTLPELVQESEAGYKSGHDFYISKAVPSQQNVYTSFAGLVDAMKRNMAGNYVLGADLDASEVNLAPADYVYLKGNFTGSLTGSHNGKQYAIYNLAKPLFENLKSGSTISNIDFKDVNIVGTYDSAALARNAENARITDLSVQGRVSVVGNASNVAGLVVNGTNTKITNSSFTGTILSNSQHIKAYNVGGLVANLKGGESLLSQSKADVTIISGARSNEQRIGGLVGRLENNARITKSYVTGKLYNSTTNGQIGGVVGSNYFNGLVDNVISNVSGTNVYSISGDQGYKNDRITQAYKVAKSETLKNDQFVTSTITQEEMEEKLTAMDITTSLDDTNLNMRFVDYGEVNNAQFDRGYSYANMEKLLPFYNKETIVSFANKIPKEHKLNKEYLLDVVPMKGDQIITDIHSNKTAINRLMLHYMDNTIDYLEISYQGDFVNQGIAEYRMKGLDLLYTPEAFVSDYTSILNQVLPELNKVVLDSPAMRTALGVAADTSLDELYLDTAFTQVKSKLSGELRKVLAMDKAINTEGEVVKDYLVKKILADKEAFLLGLTYLNRWYNINYDNFNVKDLSAYKMDFYGKNDVSVLDTIIALGKSGLENLKAKNNYTAYDNSLSEATGKRGLFNYLEGYRQLFLPYKTNNEWLKTNTKAYIVEAKSDVAEARQLQDAAEGKSKYSVGVYDKITADNWEHKGMLLPLLTMTEKGVYAISNMSTLSMGAYDRYRLDANNRVRTDAELVEYVEDRVRKTAEYQRDHYDFWYKILSPESKDKLFRSVLVYDGFFLTDKAGQSYWAPANDKKSQAMQEFFGPAGKWYPSKGYNAYATGSVTHFDRARLLEDYGNSVYTHEMTHNSDGAIYFEGYGRREGLGAELYARGLLQSSPSADEPTITLNTLFKVDKDSKTRMHTYNFKERVQNEADLQHYVHGMFDMIYTLDYLEGTSMLKQSDAAKLQWFRKIENYYITDKYGKETHAGNQTRSFTAEEIKQLKTFNSLIENDVITRRENKESGKYGRNGYLSLSLFSPIYSALSNPNGAPGDVMFRRTAYELLAAKGYHEGFVPYVSGQYSQEAFDEGKKTWDGWSGRDVGLVTDQKVLENVFKGEYTSWAAFKKAMYKERIDQLTKLKPITIEYELKNPNSTKKVTIRSYAEMQQLMDAAVAEDVRNITNATSRVESSWVNLLKKKIYNAYLRETDDFRQSIFER